MSADEGQATPASHLRKHGLAPRKRLGQNFLRDRSFLARMVDAASIERDDEVLEIGAGTGVLTRALVERAARVVGIELDDALFELLRRDLGTLPRLELWHGNALSFDPSSGFAGPYKLLGNIPYYITGPLVRRYLEIEHRPSVLVLMVQREVAERMVAQPGRLSVLGVSVQYYAAAEIVTQVPAGAFYPVPKVDSAIVRLVPKCAPPQAEAHPFFRVVRAGFGMRRKQIANSLSAGLGLTRPEVVTFLHEVGIDETRRAETLSVAEWEALAIVVATAPTGTCL